MFDARRNRRNGWDCRGSGDLDDGGYVETDPTGRYGRYDDVLGKGATKIVYRAFDELQGIEVAWNQAKICDVLRSPESLERLYSEVYLLSTLKHNSIITFHSFWVDTGKRTFNFITEMFTSGTLREYLQRYRHVNVRAVKNWARQILHGLVYLHSNDPPVIHRDLKCDNIFVNGHLGQVKIGDFGLAAVLKGAQQAHSVIGTPEFMAPELYDEEYNELVDIYSFGMCVLEMLTGDYPYSECSNPAQIYKKVTSGKLPKAYYQIKDPEAQLFIGKCLENVSRRPSAWELLLDPFLQIENAENPSSVEFDHLYASLKYDTSLPPSPTGQKMKLITEMKITGNTNPDDDTIYLRVQIADKLGTATNVFFPFDINTDTPIDVAREMVKELEIMDHDPSLIAEMIDREVSALVPQWRDEVQADVYDDHEEDGFHNSPSTSTSLSSSFGRMQFVDTHCQSSCNGIQDMQYNDDTVSQVSTYSGMYDYSSGCEQDLVLSPQSEGTEPPPNGLKSSRFCPEDGTKHQLPCFDKYQRQHSIASEPPSPSSHAEKISPGQRKFLRNRSFVDIRSQLLHRSLLEELNNRLFKTVGSVECTRYQDLVDTPCKGKKSRGASCKNMGSPWKRC